MRQIRWTRLIKTRCRAWPGRAGRLWGGKGTGVGLAHRGRAFLPFLLLLLMASAPFAAVKPCAADEMDSARLDWLPYSSSYLPFYEGYLTHALGRGMNPSLEPLMKWRVDSRDTVGERFDLLRSRVLGDPNQLEPFLDSAMYSPTAPRWEGFCHQWAAAALDPQLARILEADHDVVCQGVYLSQGEIRELVTAFYTARGDDYIGSKSDSPLDPEVIDARAELGTDQLPAYQFHQKLYDYLRQDRGIVASISLPPQVWNFPIYGAQSVSRVMTQRYLPELKPLPAYLFEPLEGASSSDALLLQAYQDAEKALYTFTIDPVRTEGERDAFARRAYEEASQIGIYGTGESGRGSGLEALLSLRSALYQGILGELGHGRIGMNPDYQVKYVSTRIDFGYEAPYASGYNIEKSEKLAYVLITRNGESTPQDSVWITPPNMRPQFMWVPHSLSSDPNANPLATNLYRNESGLGSEVASLRAQDKAQQLAALYDRERGLSELIDILSHCPSTEDVVAFYRLLQQATANNWIDPALRRRILLAYRRVKGQVNRAEIQGMLRGVSGLTLADLDSVDSSQPNPDAADLYSRVETDTSQPVPDDGNTSTSDVDSLMNRGIY